MEKNIDIRHKLLSYTNLNTGSNPVWQDNVNMDSNPSCQDTSCPEVADLKAALIKAQEQASETMKFLTEMQQKMTRLEGEVQNKMSTFEAELFAEKNHNYLMNQELQALKAES